MLSRLVKLGAAGGLVCLATQALAQTAVSTAFTYQGQLQDNGATANGIYDLQFRLLNAASGGSQVGGTLCFDGVVVADGLVTEALDFGNQFSGNALWLEVSVRADSTASNCASGTYTTLSPLQPLTAAPYAMNALNALTAQSLSGPNGTPSNVVVVDPYGRVGIGKNPFWDLDLFSSSDDMNVRLSSASTSATRLSIKNESTGGHDYQFVSTGSSNSIPVGTFSLRDNTAGAARMSIAPNGNIGIGTNAPAQLLHIVSGTDPTLKIQSDGTDEISGRLSMRQSNESGADLYYDGTNTTEAAVIETFASGTSTGKVYFSNKPGTEGYVGIGALPTVPLDVNGTMKATSIGIGTAPTVPLEVNGIIRATSIGIGTSAPAAALHIVGATDPTLKLQSDGTDEISGRLSLRQSNDTGVDLYYDGRGATEAATMEFFSGGTSQGKVYFSNKSGTVGYVGIGRVPTANQLEVEGTASKTAAGSWAANSDSRIKTNIETVTNALDTLNRVRLVSFDYTDDYRAAHPSIADRRYLNVIAQEFATVFPDDVHSSGEKLPDGSNILQVDTYPITIYTAAAAQELSRKADQQADQIKALTDQNAALLARQAELQKRLERLEAALRTK